MKKTAVEWLADELTLPEYGDNPQWVQDAIEQAKEMEKEQIIDAWLNSLTKGDFNSADEYYNQTYKLK
jgi:hypothetical protein